MSPDYGREVELDPNALALLTKIGEERSLRYASHLITMSNLIASRRPRDKQVKMEDVQRSYKLFLDSKRSAEVRSHGFS